MVQLLSKTSQWFNFKVLILDTLNYQLSLKFNSNNKQIFHWFVLKVKSNQLKNFLFLTILPEEYFNAFPFDPPPYANLMYSI